MGTGPSLLSPLSLPLGNLQHRHGDQKIPHYSTNLSMRRSLPQRVCSQSPLLYLLFFILLLSFRHNRTQTLKDINKGSKSKENKTQSPKKMTASPKMKDNKETKSDASDLRRIYMSHPHWRRVVSKILSLFPFFLLSIITIAYNLDETEVYISSIRKEEHQEALT